MLGITGVMRYRNRNAACPIDPRRLQACKRQRVINTAAYYASLGLYMTGFFFAFIAVHVLV